MTQPNASPNANANCLLRHLSDDPSVCSPLSPLYLGLHGHSGTGGRVANAQVPADYRNLLLADSPARESQAEIYTKLQAYVKSFDKQFADVQAQLRSEGQTENQIRIKSLYLWSREPGTGKTTTAAALLNEYLVRHYVGALKRGATPEQRPAYFFDSQAVQTDYNGFNRPRVPEDIAEPASRRYYAALERAKHTEFVVIDDLATRSATEGFTADLHSVINHRVVNGKPTVYTSNIPIEAGVANKVPGEVYELYDIFREQRLVDRIKDMTMDYEFTGASRRGKRK